MFSIEEFEAEYNAATTKEEQFEVLKKGLNAYGQAMGVAAAEFMEAVENEKYAESAAMAADMSLSLQSMCTGLQVIALLQKMRGE